MTASVNRGVWRLSAIVIAAQVSLAWSQNAPVRADLPTFFELHAGVMRSDNVLRQPVNEQGGSLVIAGMRLDTDHDGQRLDLIAHANLDWFQYPENTFNSDVFGFFNALAVYDIVGERFQWRAQETYGQETIEPFGVENPNNLAAVSDFTTGPRLRFPLGGATSLALSGDYSITNRETLSDSERVGGLVALIHELSASNQFSINAATQHVTFDAIPDRDYELHQLFLAYLASGRRGSVRAEAGASQLDLKAQDGNSKGLLARLDLARQVSPASTLGVYFSRQFAGAAEVFRYRLDQGGEPEGPVPLASTDVFQNQSVGVRWDFARARTQFGVDISRIQERYEREIASDRNLDRIDLRLQRRMTPHLTFVIDGFHQREEFQTVNFEARETGGRAGLEWTFGRVLGVALRQEWRKRTCTDPALEYTEGRTGVTLYYRPPHLR